MALFKSLQIEYDRRLFTMHKKTTGPDGPVAV
jgi:hypothetical protein